MYHLFFSAVLSCLCGGTCPFLYCREFPPVSHTHSLSLFFFCLCSLFHSLSGLDRTTAPAQTKIYVGNVEPHITTGMLKTVFEPFGMVVGAEMVMDPSNPGHVSC